MHKKSCFLVHSCFYMHKKRLFLCIVHFTGKLCICPVRHQDLLLLIDNFIYVLPFVSTSQLIMFPCSTIFFLIVNLHPKQLFLHKHLHPIDFRHTHISAAGFRCYPAASFFACLYRSRSEARCSGASIGFHPSASIV